MLFTEPAFLFLFLPVLLGLYGLATTKPFGLPYGNYLLVAASVIFYALGGGRFTWLMLASIALNYWAAIIIDRTRSRAMLTAAVLVNLGGLALFKYAGFAVDNLNLARQALHLTPLTVPAVALPIGISFFTFHAVSYVVDVYRGDATAQKSPVHAALYMLLFPQLIAGPIIRYRDIAGQLAR